MNVMIVTFILIYVMSLAEARAPNGRACFGGQEISLFCNWNSFAAAKTACEDNDSTLAKIDNANIAKFVNSLIDKTNCSYQEDVFIGAKATSHPDFSNDRSKRIWKWLDGSKIYLPTESGYQNWKPGQPNDYGGQEDCLIVDRLTKQWKDSPCRDDKHYICQKGLEAKMEIRINVIPDGKQCLATAGSCAAHTEWRRNGKVITRYSSHSIYQTSNLNSSILHHKNATIGDAGNYICTSWLRGDESAKQIASIELFVNGTPNIVDIKSFICNTSLLLQWAPHTRSVGFLHRILVAVSRTGEIVNVVEVTPNKSVSHFLEIGNLNSSTEYNITVVACKEKIKCSAEYVISKTATTSGIIVQVTNATLKAKIVGFDSHCCLRFFFRRYGMLLSSLRLETKLVVKINAIPGGKQCLATAGSCVAHTEWRRNSETITQNGSGSIYQTSNLDSSILHHENATIGDAGNYTCTGWLPGHESDKQIASIELFVNGTPNIVDIKSFICNTSLLLQWAPHTRSVGFLHRILVAVSLTGAIVSVVEVTPNKSVSHFLEIGNLKPSTEYNVTVVACKERNNCSAEYAVSKTATTSGIIVQVTNATLKRVTNSSYTCIVSWKWIYDMTETFQIFISSYSTETYNITKQSIFVKRNSYSFAPIPGYVYDVEVQPMTNGAYCVKTVKAVGTCFEKKFSETVEQNSVATMIVPLVIVAVLLLVVSSIAIYLRMRAPKPPQQTTVTELGDVHDYATVGNPEINDTGYMDLTDSFDNTAGKISYENIDQNASPTYETVKNVSEYEM